MMYAWPIRVDNDTPDKFVHAATEKWSTVCGKRIRAGRWKFVAFTAEETLPDQTITMDLLHANNPIHVTCRVCAAKLRKSNREQ